MCLQHKLVTLFQLRRISHHPPNLTSFLFSYFFITHRSLSLMKTFFQNFFSPFISSSLFSCFSIRQRKSGLCSFTVSGSTLRSNRTKGAHVPCLRSTELEPLSRCGFLLIHSQRHSPSRLFLFCYGGVIQFCIALWSSVGCCLSFSDT